MSVSIKFIPIQSKAILAESFAKGKTNQQTFSLLRSLNHDVSYQQVVAYRVHQEAQFNNSFNAIFNQ